ncbi:hypothetical protein Tco_1220647 [Tanacetum coccineum]
MIMPYKDKMYNGRKGISFENPSYFCKAKELRPSLYDERVIDLGYTPMFLTHSNEALEIEKFKRARENKIEFAYDYGNLNASSVNEKINFSDEYFQEIINPDFEKIYSPFQQTSSLKPYVLTKKWSSNTSSVDFSSVSNSKLNKDVKRYSRKDLLSCNNSHHVDTRNAYACNDAINVSCNSRLHAFYDVNDLFVFDDVVPKMQSLAEPVVKWIPKVERQIDKISKTLTHQDPFSNGYPKFVECNHALLTSFVEKFLGTVRFGNNDFTVIAGYGDVVIRSMTIKKVYYVEGLGHNLFSVGKFCDKGLKVAFRKTSCFVRTEDGVDLLTGDRSSNLYTISLNEIASNYLAYLLAKASSS